MHSDVVFYLYKLCLLIWSVDANLVGVSDLIFGMMITNVFSRPGGDKIYGVFDNQLPAGLKRLQFDKHLSMDNVRKLITEADGYQPHLIAPEQGYRRLIESCLVTIRGPAEAAVDAVCIHFHISRNLTIDVL